MPPRREHRHLSNFGREMRTWSMVDHSSLDPRSENILEHQFTPPTVTSPLAVAVIQYLPPTAWPRRTAPRPGPSSRPAPNRPPTPQSSLSSPRPVHRPVSDLPTTTTSTTAARTALLTSEQPACLCDVCFPLSAAPERGANGAPRTLGKRRRHGWCPPFTAVPCSVYATYFGPSAT